MAAAVSALLNHEVERIVLTRPAVEAGEALGFLPGDLREKILPYLRPLYDALHDMLDPEEVVKLTEKGVIEIAPLAYMRGRTLSRAFVVLDEAQNTTSEQMMMFLTRLGEDSRMVVTGDVTQIDLPRSKLSGLLEVRHILRDVPGDRLPHVHGSADVVRHPHRAADRRSLPALQEPRWPTPKANAGALPMSVRSQLRLLVGGLGAHRWRPEFASTPASAVQRFPRPEPPGGGPDLHSDRGGDRARELCRHAGSRPTGAAEPGRAGQDRGRHAVRLRERREHPQPSASSSLSRVAPRSTRLDMAPLERFDDSPRATSWASSRPSRRAPRPSALFFDRRKALQALDGRRIQRARAL
jgi:hypothetical protein